MQRETAKDSEEDYLEDLWSSIHLVFSEKAGSERTERGSEITRDPRGRSSVFLGTALQGFR